MNLETNKNSHTRLIIASSLFILSIVASFLISYTSHLGDHYWVTTHPLSRGVQISDGDVTLVKATFPRTLSTYLSSESTLIGSITSRDMDAGIFLSEGDISSDPDLLRMENISLAVRAVDIPIALQPGELITLYQVIDSRNGEPAQEPLQIISGIFLSDLTRKSANFASDVSITITLDRRDIPNVLAATATGRIVVASSHG